MADRGRPNRISAEQAANLFSQLVDDSDNSEDEVHSNTSYNPELDPNNLEAIKVFEYLLRDVGPGHHIYADRYYTSLNLIRFLQTKSFH